MSTSRTVRISEEESKKKLDLFLAQADFLTNYTTDDDRKTRDDNTTQAPQSPGHDVELTSKGQSKSKAPISKRKTPVKKVSEQTAIRTSPRLKRKTARATALDESSDSSDEPQSPLANKSKAARSAPKAIKPQAKRGKQVADVAVPSKESSPSKVTKRTRSKRKVTTKAVASKTEVQDHVDDDYSPTISIDVQAQTTQDDQAEASTNADGTERKEFYKCANPTCSTGQTFQPLKDTGRKAISHLFGRNKTDTSAIHPDVWHLFCRKDYQRESYRAKKADDEAPAGSPSQLTALHLRNLRSQLLRLKLWRPEATFRVQITLGAQKRLALFDKALRKPNATQADAMTAAAFVPKINKFGKASEPTIEYKFPLLSIRHFEDNLVTNDADYDYLESVCLWVEGLNAQGQAPCDPPIEFLISKLTDTEAEYEPTGNYDQWRQRVESQAAAAASDSDSDDEEMSENDEADATNRTTNETEDVEDTEETAVAETNETIEAAAILTSIEAAEESDAERTVTASDVESDDDESDDDEAPPSTPTPPARKYLGHGLYLAPGKTMADLRQPGYKFKTVPGSYKSGADLNRKRSREDDDDEAVSPKSKKMK